MLSGIIAMKILTIIIFIKCVLAEGISGIIVMKILTIIIFMKCVWAEGGC